MAGIGDQTRWRGVQPTDPAVDIPVTLDGESIVLSPPSGASFVSESNVARNQTRLLYTVTAGKTLYIMNSYIRAVNDLWEYDWAIIGIYTGADVFVDYLIYIKLLPGDSTQISLAYPVPYPVSAGYKINLVSDTAGIRASGGFAGYEV